MNPYEFLNYLVEFLKSKGLIATTDLTKAYQGSDTFIYLRVGKIESIVSNLHCNKDMLTVILDLCVPIPGDSERLYSVYSDLANEIKRWKVTGFPKVPNKPPTGWLLGPKPLQATNSAALANEIGMGMQCYFDVQYTYPTIIN